MVICCVVVPSDRVPLSNGSGSTNFATPLPDSGVCGVVTDFDCATLVSPAWLSQPAPVMDIANTPTGTETPGIEKVDRLMTLAPSGAGSPVRSGRRTKSSEWASLRQKTTKPYKSPCARGSAVSVAVLTKLLYPRVMNFLSRFASAVAVFSSFFVTISCSSGSSSTGGGGMGGSLGTGTGGAGLGTGGSAAGTGGSGTGGTVAPTFPTQACFDKADALLAQMTLDEKALQTIQSERAQTSNAQVMQYAPGSIYSQGGSAPTNNSPQGWADMINGYRSASRMSAHGIPIIYGLDSVHGLGPVKGATVFPHNIGLGATGDPAFVQQVAAVVADESAGVGADFPFAPVIAVARDERWGRTYESFAETPDLVSTMGTALVKGLQFPTGGTKISILANAKHYVGDGGTAMGVTGGNTSGDEATLRAIHLAPYHAAIAANAGSIMLSYNSWQGTKMHINKTMITDVLKGQLGFGGFVGTDYNGCAQVGMTFSAG